MWFEALSAYQRIWVGFSGGLDSTVLLHQLSQIEAWRQRVVAIHVNHGLHPEADDWQRHCEAFCQALAIPLEIKHANCPKGPNQEALARSARYQQFDACIQAGDVLLLGHHQQDQAETLLLNLCRGSGIEGLCGMWETRSRQGYTLMRPLLQEARESLQQYAIDQGLSWVEDSSNQETQFSRNYLRHKVLPLLRARWSKVDKCIYQTTQHMQMAQRNLYDLARQDYEALDAPVLYLKQIKTLPEHRLTNILWFWLKGHQLALLNQDTLEKVKRVLIFNPHAKGKRMIFAEKQIWRHQDALYLEPYEKENHTRKLEWMS